MISHADKPEWKLTVDPQKCVALRQGNVCFQDLHISWYAPVKGHYCLYIEGQEEAIKCWNNELSGELIFEFEGTKSQSFLLRKNNDKTNLIKATIEVKWVYRNKHGLRSGWRVF